MLFVLIAEGCQNYFLICIKSTCFDTERCVNVINKTEEEVEEVVVDEPAEIEEHDEYAITHQKIEYERSNKKNTYF